jgi:hypothetical protein
MLAISGGSNILIKAIAQTGTQGINIRKSELKVGQNFERCQNLTK